MTLQKKFQTCKQCGEQKELKDFRPYYNNPGHYKLCKECEAVNNKYKYLQRKMAKDVLSEEDEIAFRVIEEYYSMLREQGLQPPNYGQGHDGSGLVKNIQGRLENYKDFRTRHSVPTEMPKSIPEELNNWLTQELNNYTPEELHDNVYENLRHTWSPRIGLDEVTQLPVYDETFKPILLEILRRFDNYEEEYYAKQEENDAKGE